MAIQNLPEFAKNGQKNTDGLVLLDGFPVNKKPARQWMNFLFNQLTVAINAINAEKLDATTNAVSASKWQTARTINVSGSATGSVSIDGTKDVQLTLTLQNSGVVEGTYGSGLKVPVITTDKAGLNKVILEKDIPIFSGSSIGLVPASSTANKDKFMRGDGVWAVPDDTTYSGMTTNEINTGTSKVDRIISAYNLKYAIERWAPKQTDITGNATTATRLQTARNINLAGDASGSVEFDGSVDVTLQVKLTNNALDVLAYSPIAYPKNIAPAGFLMMMGQAISSIQYPILYGLYGSRLPDMRAHVLRGWDNGRGIDVGRTLLSEQGDAIRNITGTAGSFRFGMYQIANGAFSLRNSTSRSWNGNSTENGYEAFFDASTVVPTALENRVKSIAFNYIVKAG